MSLGWWSRLKFEPGRRLMAINHRALSGQLRTFGSGVWIVDNWSIGETAHNLPVLPICRRAYSANRSGVVIYL
jgi:hypothetical protein